MQHHIAERILFLCDLVPGKLKQLPAETWTDKPQPDKWSKKEILGHLIDSAANNHQRFVRGQIEDIPTIFYQQDQWVSVQVYQTESISVLILLWESYNRHLVHVIQNIIPANLERECRGKDGTAVTLAFLIKDYVPHLEHHLKQIVDY